jgi:hypothetical protein
MEAEEAADWVLGQRLTDLGRARPGRDRSAEQGPLTEAIVPVPVATLDKEGGISIPAAPPCR